MSQEITIQKFVGVLVQQPDKAMAFIKDPVGTAKLLGYKIDKADAQLIVNSLSAAQIAFGTGAMTGASHVDFPECHHIEVPKPSRDAVVRSIDEAVTLAVKDVRLNTNKAK